MTYSDAPAQSFAPEVVSVPGPADAHALADGPGRADAHGPAGAPGYAGTPGFAGAPARTDGARFGFGWGVGSGVVLAFVALLVAAPADPNDASRAMLGSWLTTNLGHSIWLFGVVFTLYIMNLQRLRQILAGNPMLREVVELDQLLDVWIHLFVGIGVIWTAVGMRSALQAALGEPGQALADSAGSVLQKLVDGGILLALTTTIVGGIGGYLMRLGKAITVGANLIGYYAEHQQADTRALIEVVRRIERTHRGAQPGPIRVSTS